MKVTGDCIKIQLTNDGMTERQKIVIQRSFEHFFFKIIGISI